MLLQGGQYHRLNDPDPATITMRIGVYYNYFPKLGDDNEVVFTVPYNDSGGFGITANHLRLVLLQFAFVCFKHTLAENGELSVKNLIILNCETTRSSGV